MGTLYRITLPDRRTKVCPGCSFDEARMDALYCSYCGTRHTFVEVEMKVRSVPVVVDRPGPFDAVPVFDPGAVPQEGDGGE